MSENNQEKPSSAKPTSQPSQTQHKPIVTSDPKLHSTITKSDQKPKK